MKPSALDYLVCPKCICPLKLDEGSVVDNSPNEVAGASEIMEATLSCSACSKKYPVTKGIPRFVDSFESDHTDIITGERFGQAWKTFPRMDERYRQQFFDWIFPVDDNYFKDKVVLEGGCGKGRHAKIASENGAKAVFAVDIGDTVEVAFKNVGGLENVHVVQADICNLPFGRTFDFVFSVGVLHHLNDPYKGFLALSNVLKADGALSAWVYGRENNEWLVTFVNPIRVMITSKMPTALLAPFSACLASVLYVYAKLFVHPWSLLVKKHPWLPSLFYQDYLDYVSRHDFNELHHIVLDHLVTPVAHYISNSHFQSWFQRAGMASPIIRWHNKNSWMGFYSHKSTDMRLMDARLMEPGVAILTSFGQAK